MIKDLSSYRIKNSNDISINFNSYGIIPGNYSIPIPELIDLIIHHPEITEKYTLVERKSPFYKFIVDLDYKLDSYNGKEKEHTHLIIQTLNNVLNEIFNDPDITYIYCDKATKLTVPNKSMLHGVHLYYPNIVVDTITHQEIYHRTYENLQSIDPNTNWHSILDMSVAKQNCIRLPYFVKDNYYYKPNKILSTHNYPQNAPELLKLFITKTTKFECHPKPKITLTNILESRKDINTETIVCSDIHHIIDETTNINMINQLIDMIPNTLLEDVDFWIKFVYLCKNYNIKDKCIEKSIQTHNTYTNSIADIESRFASNTISNTPITVASLINWCKTIDYIKCANICYQHGIRLKLDINYLYKLTHMNVKYNFEENSKYISKKAIKALQKAIDKGFKVLAIESPTGSAKTTSVNDIITYYNTKFPNVILDDIPYINTIISIVVRRSMCASHYYAYNKKLHLNQYLDTSYDPNYDMLIISSIDHLIHAKIHYKIVILDEFNLILKYFYSSTLDDRRQLCYNKFINILQNASLIIICDSNITDICHNLIDLSPDIFGKVFKYKNHNQNRIGINLKIYNSLECSETKKLISFCQFIIPDILKSLSVFILTDSKYLTEHIHTILKKHNHNEDYFALFNEDHGTVEELVKCNEFFIGKCVIGSPKIVTGLDVIIKYTNIYCVYAHMGSCFNLSGDEIHQQYSRSRNCQNILICNLDHMYKTRHNYYIPYEIHVEQEKERCNKYVRLNNTTTPPILKNQKTAFEIPDPSFKLIHNKKTYFDMLLNHDKLSVVEKLASDAGYTVTKEELPLLKEYDPSLLKELEDSTESHKEIINQVYEKIFNNNEMSQSDTRIQVNLVSKMRQYMPLFGIKSIDNLTPIFHECMIDETKMNLYINKKFLDASREDLASKYINNPDVHHVIKQHCNKLKFRIFTLEKLEDIVGIERYKINNIDPNINILDVKTKFESLTGELVVMNVTGTARDRVKEEIKTKIAKIDSLNKLQKFIADAYNTFGDIITVTSKRMRIKGKQETIYCF